MADNFRIELRGVKEALATLDPNKVRLAANRTLNRVAISARKEASDLISQGYNITPARLGKYLCVAIRARGDNTEAVITGRGLGLPLIHYDAKQAGIKLIGAGAGSMRTKFVSTTKRAGRGPVKIPGVGWRTVSFGGDVSVKIHRGAGRKIVPPVAGLKPFIAQMKSGHIGVFVRTGDWSHIEQRFGPGIGGLFGSRKIMNAVMRGVTQRFRPEFDRQLNYYLKRR